MFISQSKTAVSDDHFTNAKQLWPEQANSQHQYTQSVTMPKSRLYMMASHSIYLVLAQEYAQQLALTNIKAQYSVSFSLRMCSSKGHASSYHYAITQVALATLLGSYNVSLKPDHPVPTGSSQFGYTPDAVHIILNKL
eukprot:1766-Heterococcus_DN1.PRE.6